jgi:4-hydroxy-3-polyprenylbenzoate decarboxylase
MEGKKKIVIGITGASGSIYALRLMQKLGEIKEQIAECSIVMSEQARAVAKHELEPGILEKFPFKYYENDTFMVPFASGSANYDAMIVIPCSVGSLARIAHGTAENLISRTADVMLKERRKLILVVRESPYSLIHLENMTTVTRAGGIIVPASPSFYNKPRSLFDIVDTVVDRSLQLAGFEIETKRWDPQKLGD